jgi:alpha-tubulin suppressor-like RCC1 family protein
MNPAARGLVAALALVLAAAWLAAGALVTGAAAEPASQPGWAPAGGLDAGVYHTCGLLADGKVLCWGYSGSGQLGLGHTDTIGDDEIPSSTSPVELGPGRATALAAGDYHTCALLHDGRVHCWGFGADGRLGYADSHSVGDDETPGSVGPVDLGPGRRATAISAGTAHTCAILDDGTVRCWGYNFQGQLGYGNQETIGDNETPGSVGPVDLGTGRTAKAITAGGSHTCALLDDGAVRCWGLGTSGQLGYGNTNRVGDDEVPASHGLLGVSCPSETQCTAVDNIGRHVTFNPATSEKRMPVAIAHGRMLNGVSCPTVTQCTAVDDAGRQVTFDPSSQETPTPVIVDPGRALNAVSCPSVTQCTAVDDAGQQVTFDPSVQEPAVPTTIDATNVLNGVACPSVTQCTAVDNGGRQVTFNPAAPGTPVPSTIDNANRLLAVACPTPSQCTAVDNIGQQVTFNPSVPGSAVATAIDTSQILNDVACPSVARCSAVDNLGRQVTFNPSAFGVPVITVLDGGDTLRSLACPSATQCSAVGSFGRQVTFNPAAPGSATASMIDAAPPVDLGPGRTANAIAAGGAHTCAILDDAAARCWGDGGQGQLGTGATRNLGHSPATTPSTIGPVDLEPGRSAIAISAGGSHACARLDDGSVRCWGYGANGRLGYGNTASIGDDEVPGTVGPVDLGHGRTALAVALGQDHTCARLDDGSVRCWGYGANGRLGSCRSDAIGDNERPGTVPPIHLEGPGGPCDTSLADGGSVSTPAPAGAPTASAVAADPRLAEARRARQFRKCLAAAEHRASPRRSRGRRSCSRRFGRTPGRVTGLRARAISSSRILLSFIAPGSDGARPAAARSYVVKQSPVSIPDRQSFSAARSLCKGRCRFSGIGLGARLNLTIRGLRPHTRYYYVVAARDNVTGRLGPRSTVVKATTR